MNSWKDIDNKYDMIAYIWSTIIKLLKNNWKKLLLLFGLIVMFFLIITIGFKCKCKNIEIEKRAIGNQNVEGNIK